MQNVVRVFGAKPREHDPPLVGLAIAVGVGQVQQLGAVRDVRAAIAGGHAGGDEQAIGKNSGLVGLAVAVGVFEHQHLVVRLLAWGDLRIDLARGHPQASGRIEVDLNRLGQQRIGRVEIDLEPIGHDERLPLDLGIGIGNVAQVILSAGRRSQGEGQRGDGEQGKKSKHGGRLVGSAMRTDGWAGG